MLASSLWPDNSIFMTRKLFPGRLLLCKLQYNVNMLGFIMLGASFLHGNLSIPKTRLTVDSCTGIPAAGSGSGSGSVATVCMYCISYTFKWKFQRTHINLWNLFTFIYIQDIMYLPSPLLLILFFTFDLSMVTVQAGPCQTCRKLTDNFIKVCATC